MLGVLDFLEPFKGHSYQECHFVSRLDVFSFGNALQGFLAKPRCYFRFLTYTEAFEHGAYFSDSKVIQLFVSHSKRTYSLYCLDEESSQWCWPLLWFECL